MASSRITTQFVKNINTLVTGRVATVVKPNELESSINRPAMISYYQPGTPPSKLAAALAFSIIQNHPFMDGNKRMAFWTANEYLREMGVKPFIDADLSTRSVMGDMQLIGDAHSQVAQGAMTDEGLYQVYARVLEVPKAREFNNEDTGARKFDDEELYTHKYKNERETHEFNNTSTPANSELEACDFDYDLEERASSTTCCTRVRCMRAL
ncbi:hypothetical protein FISHEDRAFT_78200 [Fistulina hepatica ATCC 64428]|nr:hypothetical protein FISHEDRAFT_78200 [Fistulina hepatica ATCC 64428]